MPDEEPREVKPLRLSSEILDRLVIALESLVEELQHLHLAKQILEKEFNDQIQRHTTWINQKMAELAKNHQENQELQRKWFKDELAEWREGERRRMQERQLEISERMTHVLEEEHKLHKETHEDLLDGDEWKRKG